MACALVGWAVVQISAQINGAQYTILKYGAPPAPNTSARNGEPAGRVGPGPDQ